MLEIVSQNFSDLKAPNVEIKQFPDGDSYVWIQDAKKAEGKDVRIFHRLYPDQNSRIFELVLIANILKEHGVKSMELVAPYLPYARQDKIWKDGETKSAEVLCGFLHELGIKKLITVDCHFIKKEGPYKCRGLEIMNHSMSRALVEHAKSKFGGEEFEVISPDRGASYLVEEFGGDSMKKTRGDYQKSGDEAYRTIEKVEYKKNLSGKNILIMDDMISTGGTMIRAVENVKKNGAKKVACCAAHGFFLKESLFKLRTGSDGVFVSDTIPSPVSEVKFMDEVKL